MGIQDNLTKIKEQIGNNNVKIIAVTKYANEKQVFEAYRLGITDFGESYVQDALKKISQKSFSANWHFIGRLQKNKVKNVVGNFILIHSVDSPDLAGLISKVAAKLGIVQDILLQVNISQEKTKTGFSEDEAKSSFGELTKLPNLNLRGLMTIAPKIDDKELIRNTFFKLAGLKEEINKSHLGGAKMTELSMGMSNDYKIAIECGSTMVRIGRGLFNNNI